MTLLNLLKPDMRHRSHGKDSGVAALLSGYSIEITPRTAEKVDRFGELLPRGARVYVAHVHGTPIADMVATSRRVRGEGFAVMPHIPARAIRCASELEEWIVRYRTEANVEEALLLTGGLSAAQGSYESSVDLIRTGLFEKHGFRRLHVAGHPEGNRDIDPDGSTTRADEALLWKQAFARSSGVEMAITTQFLFNAKPAMRWAERLCAMGVTLPIHLGLAGPTKLQTLIKYGVACGVGPSLKVLRKRALDVTKLLLPYEPTEVISELAECPLGVGCNPIRGIHLFPLGGIRATAEWASKLIGIDQKNVET